MVVDRIREHRLVLRVQLRGVQVGQYLSVSLQDIVSWWLVLVIGVVADTHPFLSVAIDEVSIRLSSQKLMLLVFIVNLYLRWFL